jgi:D-tyrosyl-tRNA(Tyr) deacylase
VTQARVTVNGQVISAIDEHGLLVLVGVTHDDTSDKARKLAAKLWGLRILPGEKSCSDLGAPLLVISQFTVYGEVSRGRRPSWSAAAPGPVAEPVLGALVQALRAAGARVQTGVFGAEMKVSLVNDGPVTVVVDLLPDRLTRSTHEVDGVASLAGASPAITHCGRARSDTWSCALNDWSQNVWAACPQ